MVFKQKNITLIFSVLAFIVLPQKISAQSQSFNSLRGNVSGLSITNVNSTSGAPSNSVPYIVCQHLELIPPESLLQTLWGHWQLISTSLLEAKKKKCTRVSIQCVEYLFHQPGVQARIVPAVSNNFFFVFH